MRIALVVDNPSRDLPGLVLLARQLVHGGATCFLVPMNLQQTELSGLAPDFVLLNYLRSSNQTLAGKLMDAGIEVGVLDTEGGVFASLDAYARSLASDARVRDRVSCFMTWGRRLAKEAVSRSWFRSDVVEVTGAPRMDFYSPSLRNTALQFSRFIEELGRPLVLINGNFPVANPAFRTVDEEASALCEQFGFSRDDVNRWVEVQGRAIEAMSEMTVALSKRFPEVSFVYRPHPFERLQTYVDLMEQRPNVTISKRGTVDGWILRASAVVQRGCTTAIEAGMAGVAALSPQWIETSHSMTTAEAVSVPCATLADLEGRIAETLDGKSLVVERVRATLDEIVEDWFHKNDGRSHERVANVVLERAGRSQAGRPDTECCKRIMYGLEPPPATRTARIVANTRMRLGLSPWWSLRQFKSLRGDRWESSEKYFDRRDVARIMNALECDGAAPTRVTLADDDYRVSLPEGRSIVVRR